MNEIQQTLFSLQEKDFRDFQIRLIPTIDPDTVIGVRTPALRKYARELAREGLFDVFTDTLPHRYFEENQLHAFLVSDLRDFSQCVTEVVRFLPYVNNWATCDQMSPRIFKHHRKQLLPHIRKWLRAGETYTVRFAIGMLMQHFLEEDFDAAYPDLVAKIRPDDYYVHMMIAWYFATALAKQYDAVLPYLENHRLDLRTHNKTIQKAVESRRISQTQKDYLRSLRRRSCADATILSAPASSSSPSGA